MKVGENPFQTLADQARRGDSTATIQLRKQMEPQAVWIVRHTLAARAERTPLERQIFAAARRMGLEQHQGSRYDREEFILNVARDVCGQVMDKIRASREAALGNAETVRGY